MAYIRAHLEALSPSYEAAEVRTIDGYQGKEKEVILVSLARCNRDFKLGLFSDVRRMNVAITRAKRLCLIFGDSETYKVDEDYETLIRDLKQKACVINIPKFNELFNANIEIDQEWIEYVEEERKLKALRQGRVSY